MHNGRAIRNVLVGAVMAVAIAVMAALPTFAYGEIKLEVYPTGTKTKNPVADNITRLNVNKLEKGARDGVVGAKLCIINKETGEMVGEPWISDGTTHEIARNSDNPKSGALDIDVVYILRELEAPEGYAKAADTEFVIHSDNFNTTGEILSGPDADSEEIHGSGPEQAFVINLYDEATMHVTDEERRTRERETQEQQEVQQQTGNRQQGTTYIFLVVLHPPGCCPR